jgi:hypothetical protein
MTARARLLRNALLFWPALLALAILNGVAREAVLDPLTGPAAARPLSGLTLMGLLAVGAWLFMRGHVAVAPGDAALAGAVWLALTLVAEVVLFALAVERPFEAVARTFTPAAIASGELFAVAAAWLALLPLLIVWLRRLANGI